jgi:hypothetical protein
MRYLPAHLTLTALALLLPVSSQAATFTFCMKWRVQTQDSGRTVMLPDGSLIQEDHWATDTSTTRTAHGMLFTVQRPGLNGGFPLLLWANPATGCANLTDAAGMHAYVMRAYTVSVDGKGNTIRIVDAMGSPYYFDMAVWATSGVALSVPVPSNPFFPLTDDQKAIGTLAGVSAFAAYRSTYGVTGKRIDIKEGAASSAHGGPDVDLSQLQHGYIRISIKKPTHDDASDHRTMKYIVTHEMGHAWLLLNHGGGVEPNVALDYDASIDDDSCHYLDDGSDQTYTIDSLEYTAVGFREGFAHFYAARVWNDADPDGVFTWFGDGGRSLAHAVDPDLGGGRTFQQCQTAKRKIATLCADNVTTNGDWLRMLWAWHTADPAASTSDIRNVYERTWDNGGLAQHNYQTKLAQAVTEVIPDAYQQFLYGALADFHGLSSGENSRCP